MSLGELVGLMISVQALLSGGFWLISRLIGGSIMAQVNKKDNILSDKIKDSQSKIISIMVKDKEELYEMVEGNLRQVNKDIIDGDRSSIKHAHGSCISSQRDAEDKRKEVRAERQEKYLACINNITDSMKKLEDNVSRHNTNMISNLSAIADQINQNAKEIAVHDDRFKNMKNKEG